MEPSTWQERQSCKQFPSEAEGVYDDKQDMEGMPGSAATRTLQSHRYGDFAENGDDDSDEDEDNGRPFAMVCLLSVGQTARKSLALRACQALFSSRCLAAHVKYPTYSRPHASTAQLESS